MTRLFNRSHSTVVSRVPRRKTLWIASAAISGGTALSGTAFIFDQALGTAALALRPFTITRTVGMLFIASDQTAATERPFGALGMFVPSEKAATTGTTALIDPITEEDSDQWFMYTQWGVKADTVSGAPQEIFKFDSRGQRKVEDGQDVAVMIANAASAVGVVYTLKFRMLVKLH